MHGIAGLWNPGARITIFAALNRAFADWREIFPNAACVVSMVDRLMHNAEVVSMKGTQTVFARHS